MNYSIASRHSLPFVNSRKETKSPLSEGYASSHPHTVWGATARRTNPTTTSRISSTTTGSSRVSSSQPAVSNKWFREPKIPIRLTSSTLIRMKSKNPSNKEMGDNRTNNQLTVAALSFLKRDRRMSDFEVAKGISPYGDNSYVKNVCLNIVSHYDHQAMVQASANSFGDGVHTDTTYHRIAAFSVNGCKTGCDVKYVEQVSYKSVALSPQTLDSVGQSNPVVSASKNGSTSFSVSNLNAMLKQATLSESKKTPNDDLSDVSSEEEKSVGIRPVVKKKKKISRKHKKAVLVTGMKNTSLKLMSKSSTRGT